MQQDRRKNKRTDLDSKLVIKRLDGNSGNEVTINITDISKEGVGFECNEPLQIGEVYEAYLTIWTKEVLAIFIGMPEMDSARIEVYQTVNEE